MTGLLELKINDKKYLVKIGNYALYEYCQLTGLSVENIGEGQNVIQLAADMIYCGLKNQAFSTNTVCDFTREDIISWLDSIPFVESGIIVSEVIKALQGAVTNSMETIKAMNLATEGKKSKKKSPGEKSPTSESEK